MRKPVDLTATNGSPRQRMWDAIRAQQGKDFAARDVTWHTGELRRDTVRSYLYSLEAAGILEARPPAGSPPRRQWRLVKDHGIEAPRVNRKGETVTQGRGRENMWRVIRMPTTEFSWIGLAVLASTDQTVVAEQEAREYCQSLAKAGYLLDVSPRKNKCVSIYRFNRTMDTGPLPPMIQRIKSVWDQNLRKIVWQAEVDND